MLVKEVPYSTLAFADLLLMVKPQLKLVPPVVWEGLISLCHIICGIYLLILLPAALHISVTATVPGAI